jgi:hypothetical protein
MSATIEIQTELLESPKNTNDKSIAANNPSFVRSNSKVFQNQTKDLGNETTLKNLKNEKISDFGNYNRKTRLIDTHKTLISGFIIKKMNLKDYPKLCKV